MSAEELNKEPSVYEQLSFIDNIYKTEEELHAKLAETGFKMYSEIEVPKVDSFVYVPTSFPQTEDEVNAFDFEAYADKRFTVGICIGGTCLSNGWDEKCKLGVQGILKINHNCSSADKAATQIFLALDDLCRDYNELAQHNIRLDVHICGYSLGGLFAQVATVLLQDWAYTTGNRVTCRTFEAPGVPEMYHEISENYDENADAFWKQRITNFKSLPNPLNTVFKDIGRVFHLKNIEHIKCNGSWIFKCLAGTTKRIVFWSSLLKGFGITSIEGAFSSLEKTQQRLLIGATIALELGMDLCEIVRNHDVELMMQCFDRENGNALPGVCIEMQGWPVYEMFEDSVITLLQSVSRGMVLMDPKNAGLHTLFLWGGKRGFVERKLSDIPGYLPLSNAKPEEIPAHEE